MATEKTEAAAPITPKQQLKQRAVQREVNTHISAAKEHRAGQATESKAARATKGYQAKLHAKAAVKHSEMRKTYAAKVAKLRKKLPPGFAMIHGKVRKIAVKPKRK